MKLPWYKIIQIPFAYPIWLMLPKDKRITTFKEVLQGAEKHKHHYLIPETIQGVKFLRCSHPGCMMYDPVDNYESQL